MGSFSERYGYVKVSDALIVEKITPEIINAIYNCYKMYIYPRRFDGTYETVQKEVCNRFLNQVLLDSSYDYISPFLLKGEYEWYKYLDFLEFVIGILILNNSDVAKIISDEVNKDFERLNYGYRIINNLVTPITSKEEVHSIEEAISSAKGNIKEHLNSALKHLADKENPDYIDLVLSSGVKSEEPKAKEKSDAEDSPETEEPKVESKTYEVQGFTVKDTRVPFKVDNTKYNIEEPIVEFEFGVVRITFEPKKINFNPKFKK